MLALNLNREFKFRTTIFYLVKLESVGIELSNFLS